MASTATKLKGIDDFSDYTLCQQLESNLIEFFNWGLLNVGAFRNVSYHEQGGSGVFSGDISRLRPVQDPQFIDGQVWEAYRNDWIWESGIEYPEQPIQISGVYVDSTFYPSSTTGVYSHYADYNYGRIVFNDPIPINSIVNIEYAYRYYHFTTDAAPWFRQIMFRSFRINDSTFLQYGSGVWDILASNRVQLPAVVVEVVPRRNMTGYQLGGGQCVYQDVLFHIFTEDPDDRKRMLDILTYQKDKTIESFDKNMIAAADAFPLTYYGTIASGALTYPDLVKPTGDGGYAWKKITFNDMKSQESISVPPLHQGVVRGTFWIVMPEL